MFDVLAVRAALDVVSMIIILSIVTLVLLPAIDWVGKRHSILGLVLITGYTYLCIFILALHWFTIVYTGSILW